MADTIRRPNIWLNCAVSLDGRLAYAGGKPARLSGPEDLARVQRLRADSDAILVGVGTVLADDPSLRVHWEMTGRPVGKSPLRVILDSLGRTPPGARVLDGSIPTLVATSEGVERAFPSRVSTFSAGVGAVDIVALLAHLRSKGVERLMVEGGSRVLAAFLRGGWFDTLTVYVAPLVIGGTSAPTMVGGPDPADLQTTISLRRTGVEPLGDGILLTFQRVAGAD